MSNIRKALMNFLTLSKYKYHFILAYKKKRQEIHLIFQAKDFYHLAGLHYLKDIVLPKHPTKLFPQIIKNIIDDEYLQKSTFYYHIRDKYVNVHNRIYGLQFLDVFLDSKNIICKYIRHHNRYSVIKADYLIKSTVNHMTAYIFLKERKKSGEYCICSFFIDPPVDYLGEKVYWLYKSKIDCETLEEEVLYDNVVNCEKCCDTRQTEL